MCESWSPRLELLALSLWAAVFPRSSMFSIVNEEDRRERGLLVLIYPGGSLGITINSQLLAHSTGLHRHCQFVPIREPSFWVSAVKGSSGRTGEQPARAWFGPDHGGFGCTWWWNNRLAEIFAITFEYATDTFSLSFPYFALRCLWLKMFI